MAKKQHKAGRKKTKPAGRENVRIRPKTLPNAFPPETCERLRNLAKHANKATTEKARCITARDAKVEEINACAETETKKLERLKAEGWDIERQITRWHDEGKWARDELIATVENADDLKLIQEPDYADPRPPEPGDEDEDEETPRFQDKPRKGGGGSPAPSHSLPASDGTDAAHWSRQWYRLFQAEAKDLPSPDRDYFRDLQKNGIDSPCAFLAAIRLNAAENAPLLRNVEPELDACRVLEAIRVRYAADWDAKRPVPAEFTDEQNAWKKALGPERLKTVADLVAKHTAEATAS